MLDSRQKPSQLWLTGGSPHLTHSRGYKVENACATQLTDCGVVYLLIDQEAMERVLRAVELGQSS